MSPITDLGYFARKQRRYCERVKLRKATPDDLQPLIALAGVWAMDQVVLT